MWLFIELHSLNITHRNRVADTVAYIDAVHSMSCGNTFIGDAVKFRSVKNLK